MAACRSCGAPIRWTRTTQGKTMPIDEAPVEGGNVVLTGGESSTRAGTRVPVARVIDPDAPSLPGVDPGERYVSHFATCPHADSWRST